MNFMTFETACKIVDLAYAGCQVRNQQYLKDGLRPSSIEPFGLNFFGGEPTLQLDMIEKLIEYCVSKGYDIQYDISTNATTVDERLLALITKYKIKVAVSIDGCKETHDHFRDDSYDAAIAGVKRLLVAAPYLEARYCPVKGGLHLIAEGVKSMYAAGIRNMMMYPVLDGPEWDADDAIEVEKQLNLITDWVLDELLPAGKFDFFLHTYDMTLGRIADKDVWHHFETCALGSQTLGTGYNGDAVICPSFVNEPPETYDNFVVGSFVEDSLDEEKYTSFLKDYTDTEAGCLQCEYRSLCSRPCAHSVYSVTGKLYGKIPTHCLYQKAVWGAAKHFRKRVDAYPRDKSRRLNNFKCLWDLWDQMKREYQETKGFSKDSLCKYVWASTGGCHLSVDFVKKMDELCGGHFRELVDAGIDEALNNAVGGATPVEAPHYQVDLLSTFSTRIEAYNAQYDAQDICNAGCQQTCASSCAGSCVGSCVGGCQGSCTSACAQGCSSGCTGGCIGGCASQCASGCPGGCPGSCTGQTCQSQCSGSSCSGNCPSSCRSSCSGSCSGNCGSGCATQTCKGTCSGGCYAACPGQCKYGCTSSCATDCGSSCAGGSCKNNCSGCMGNACSTVKKVEDIEALKAQPSPQVWGSDTSEDALTELFGYPVKIICTKDYWR